MMPAAKHFDPVLGVDIHIIQPPGPVPPVPIPHPHIGILIDPADYVPIIGATVMVGGVPRSIAGTAGKAIPSHIPIGGTFIKPPGNEDEMFMGSSTVSFDGDAASYMALPNLSCHDVGMVPPPRPKKKGTTKSMVLPTSVVLPIPAGPPVLIGGSPTISLMALGMRVGMAALGRGLRRLARTRFARRLARRFRRFRRRIFRRLPPGFVKCNILRAEPVDVVTGEVVVEQQDFSIPGRIPLEWNRYYGSHSTRMGVCGYGWETPADARLEFELDGSVTFYDGKPGATGFDSLPLNGPVLDPVDGVVLDQVDGQLIVRLKQGLTYIFEKPSKDKKELLVTKVQDRCGNYLEYIRKDGQLTEIKESAGRSIKVSSRNGLIEKLEFVHPGEPEPRSLVRFEYNESGDLITVYDALNAPYCFYYNNHCLIQHTNRNGLSFYYEYDEYTAEGRCVHTYGDGGLYNYHFKFLDQLGRTEITNSLGHIFTVQYNSFNLIDMEIDPLGGITKYEYDDIGRTTAVINPANKHTEYYYDARGNLLRLVRPDSSAITNTYDEANELVIRIDPDNNLWRYEKVKGLLRKVTTPRGAVWQYEYSSQGDLVATINTLGVKTSFVSDQYGNLVALTDPLRHTTYFVYDATGNLSTIVDPLGQKTSYQYDVKRRLIQVNYPSGSTVQMAYDNQDNLVAYRDQNGHLTRLKYTGTAKVAERVKPDSTTVSYQYDTEEQLTAVINERGETYKFIRDTLGRIVKKVDYWGQVTEYTFDSVGNVTQIKNPLGRVTEIIYDDLWRIVEKTYFNGKKESYTYDPNGNLILAENEVMTILREFDDDGNMVSEKQGAFTIENDFDLLGRRIKRTTSHGNILELTYNAADNVSEFLLNGLNISHTKYDALGRIKEETLLNNLKRTMYYDKDGRLIHKQRQNDRAIAEWRYEYDHVGNLTRLTDANKSTDILRYDAVNQVFQHIDPLGNIHQLSHDPAGDLLQAVIDPSGLPPSALRVAEYNTVRYEFDAIGNLVFRKKEKGEAKFVWDGCNRLASAVNEMGQLITFGYDALGRRIFKSVDGKKTHFFWDGDVLLSQQKDIDEKPREYVFRERTFEPFAFVENNVCYFDNDHIGLPHEVFDEYGQRLWGVKYGPSGQVKEYDKTVINNAIRFQGQYFDEELDLSYNRFRYFDSNIGGFVSPDPMGLAAGINLYAYGPNPWAWADPWGLTCGPITMDEALDLANDFMEPGVPIRSIDQVTGVQFIQEFTDEAGNRLTRRVGFDVNPASAHVQDLGPHLNLQTQINGVPVRNGPLADPHIPIDSSSVRPGDY